MRREQTVVTVEKMHDGNLLADPTLAAGTLPGFYVEAVAVVERGCWPLPLPDYYAWDAEHLKEYVRLAATDEGLRYLDNMSMSRRRDQRRTVPSPGWGRVRACYVDPSRRMRDGRVTRA